MSLQLPWKKFWYRFDGDFILSCGTPVILMASEKRELADQTDADTGLDLWDASVALALYLDSNRNLCSGIRVLELGSGCSGLPGIVCSIGGAKSVTFSDLKYCLPALKCNLARNAIEANVIEHDWNAGSPGIPVDIIIASDVIWLEALVEPFVRCVASIVDANVNASLILSHQSRSAAVDKLFSDLMIANGFVQTVLVDDGLEISRFSRM